ncbi:unnamed protein product [Hydatigera taeniaeformis]|uniref:Uncharacterized protein n=1 Tax=Hydatigena taeniaeformis TaxID=6205 RepID=A0A0R3XDL2_HYDTA|nr:unnamed protein product [Hydatigera taeniaeformis]
MSCINAIQRCDSAILMAERASAAAAWEAENVRPVSKFAQSLIQLNNGVTVPPRCVFSFDPHFDSGLYTGNRLLRLASGFSRWRNVLISFPLKIKYEGHPYCGLEAKLKFGNLLDYRCMCFL